MIINTIFKLYFKLDLDNYINFNMLIINYIFVYLVFIGFEWDLIEIIFEIFLSKIADIKKNPLKKIGYINNIKKNN